MKKPKQHIPQLSERQMAALQDIRTEKQQELAKMLEETMFPVSEIPTDFSTWVHKALRHEKQSTLQCTWPILKSLLEQPPVGGDRFTLQQLGFACNSIEDKTPAEMEVTAEEYIVIMEAIQAMAATWQQINKDLGASVIEKYKTQENLVRSGKTVQP